MWHGATIHRIFVQDLRSSRIQVCERLVKSIRGENVLERTLSPSESANYDIQGLMGDTTTLLNSENVNMVDVDVHMTKNLADMMVI